MKHLESWLIPYLVTDREFIFQTSLCYIKISFGFKTRFKCGCISCGEQFHWGYCNIEKVQETSKNVMRFVLQLPAKDGKDLLNSWNSFI